MTININKINKADKRRKKETNKQTNGQMDGRPDKQTHEQKKRLTDKHAD